jgi:hypothetical protein
MHAGIGSDGILGPLVACAAGGVAAELIDRVSLRLVPLGEEEAGEIVRELPTFPLLDGSRNRSCRFSR